MSAMCRASFSLAIMPRTFKSSTPITANSRTSRVVVCCNQSRRTFLPELHPSKDRQAHPLAVKREGPGAVVQACRIAHALLLEFRIAALLVEESLERRPAILNGLLGHALGN